MNSHQSKLRGLLWLMFKLPGYIFYLNPALKQIKVESKISTNSSTAFIREILYTIAKKIRELLIYVSTHIYYKIQVVKNEREGSTKGGISEVNFGYNAKMEVYANSNSYISKLSAIMGKKVS